MSRSEARKIARDLRKELQQTDKLFYEATFRAKVIEAFKGNMAVRESAVEGYAHGICDELDRELTRERSGRQPDLPGFRFDLEGEYKTGDGGRILKGAALRDHMKQALDLNDRNLRGVMNANLVMHDEFDRLAAYHQGDVKKRDAVAAYYTDNPHQRPPQAADKEPPQP
jgi:hypothetical protein